MEKVLLYVDITEQIRCLVEKTGKERYILNVVVNGTVTEATKFEMIDEILTSFRHVTLL